MEHTADSVIDIKIKGISIEDKPQYAWNLNRFDDLWCKLTQEYEIANTVKEEIK